MSRRSLTHLVLPAATFALFTLLLSPARAHAVAADSVLGTPQMFGVTGKIPPPFSYRFNLSVAVAGWPPLIETVSLGPADMTPDGVISTDRVFSNNGPPYNNEALMWADTQGRYGTFADMTEFLTNAPYVPVPYVGTFAFVQWSQSFVKDSVTSWCSFTSSTSALRARSAARDTGRAEFAMTALLTRGSQIVDVFSQQSGVLAWDSTGFGPTQFATWFVGPMPVPASTDPSGMGIARQYTFAPYTHTFDLSSLAVGDTFTVTIFQMTQGAIGWGELPGARALFVDPVTGAKSTFAKHACTPVDGLTPATVGVAPPPAAGVASVSAPWPNPSRRQVFFTLELPRAGRVTLEVFDAAGRRCARVADGEYGAGRHVLAWNPSRDGDLRPGVYLARASGPGFAVTRRVVWLGVE